MFYFENFNNKNLFSNLINTTNTRNTVNSMNSMMNNMNNCQIMMAWSSMFQGQDFFKERRINQWRTLDIS